VKYFSDHEEYYLRYRLDNDPFPEVTADNILYVSPELNHRLELIKHLLEFSQQMVLVTAPPEAGKSTLCGYLPTTFDDNWPTGVVAASETMDLESLADAIVGQIYPDDKSRSGTAVNRLQKYLEYCDREHKLPVILIDDGHKLSIDALSFILQLNALTHNATRFRFIIFADPRINTALDDPRIKVATTGIIHSINIPLLTEAQTAAYLEYRLLASGKVDPYPFTDQDASHIYKVSGGAPGRINRLARQAMLDPAILADGQGMLLSVLAPLRRLRNPILSALVICLAIGVYYYARERAAKQPPLTIAVALPPEQNHPGVTTSSRPQPLPPVPEQAQEEPDMAAGTPASATELSESAPQMVAAPGPQSGANEDLRSPPLPVPKAEPPAPVTSAPRTSAPPQSATARPEPRTGAFAGLKDSDWIRSQDPGQYVLQLIGARDLKSLEQYLAAAPALRPKLVFISTYNAGKPWYVFLYGMYRDHDSAVADVATLPAVVRKGQPWPRTVASVQSDLQKGQ